MTDEVNVTCSLCVAWQMLVCIICCIDFNNVSVIETWLMTQQLTDHISFIQFQSILIAVYIAYPYLHHYSNVIFDQII